MTLVARPTTYKGIRMRSRLEARVAAGLDSSADGAPWKYEPRAFANEHGQYLPDFEIEGLARPTFLEVKPTIDAALGVLERMQIIWDSLPNATLWILVPRDSGVACRSYTLMQAVGDQDDRRWTSEWVWFKP